MSNNKIVTGFLFTVLAYISYALGLQFVPLVTLFVPVCLIVPWIYGGLVGGLATNVVTTILVYVSGLGDILPFIFSYAIPSIAVGIFIVKVSDKYTELRFFDILGISVGTQLLGLAMNFLIMFLRSGESFKAFLNIDKEAQELVTAYEKMGIITRLTEQGFDAATAEQIVQTTAKWVVNLTPGFVGISVLVSSYISFLILRYVLQKTNGKQIHLPGFAQWHVSSVFIVPIIFGWAIVLARQYIPEVLFIIGLNILVFVLFLALIDGISYFYARFKSARFTKLQMILFVILIIVAFQGFVIFALVSGIFDILMNFRKKWAPIAK